MGKDVFGCTSYPRPFVYISCDRSAQCATLTFSRVGIDPDSFPAISLPETHRAFHLGSVVELAFSYDPKCEVIFIDGFATLVPDGKINDYRIIQRFLTDALHYCQDRNITIVGFVHATKVKEGEKFVNPRQRILGSVAWAGFSDTVILIEPSNPEDPSSGMRDVFLMPRNAKEDLLKYQLNDKGLFEPVDLIHGGPYEVNPSKSPRTRVKTDIDRMLDEVAVGEEITHRTICSWGSVIGISQSSVARWINRMCELGCLIKIRHGLYRKQAT